jgi:hypothetical protein
MTSKRLLPNTQAVLKNLNLTAMGKKAEMTKKSLIDPELLRSNLDDQLQVFKTME